MSNVAIQTEKLGKVYRLYKRPADKILDAFGLGFWRKNYYQEFWALKDIDLVIRRGERLGIIGRNGAGKSTLLKMIIGNISPTEGQIHVNGNIQALMELGTGFHPEFTGRQNIRVSLSYQGLSPKQIALKEEEIVEFAELEEFIDQPIKTYSAGMYARLAFSAATAIEPDILIIDEVLGAGDAYFAGKCLEHMRKITDNSGVTVLFVSHDLGSVQALCNRVIWVDRGTVSAEGDPLEVIKQYSSTVRREDEIRLKARDLKVSKKQAVLLDREQDIYQTFLFRFVGSNGGHPQGTHKIRSIDLKYADEEIGKIYVGAPMDNNKEYENQILSEPGHMDWGPSGKDNLGYYRIYGNYNGRYAHAPFQFLVPNSVSFSKNLVLGVLAESDGENVAVEFYNWNTNVYERLGFLKQSDGITTSKFELCFDSDLDNENSNRELTSGYELDNHPIASAENEIACEFEESRDIRFTSQCRVLRIELKDKSGRSAKVFPFENQFITISFTMEFMRPVSNFVVAMVIFLNNGTIVTNSFEEVKLEPYQGTMVLTFDFSNQKFGPGDYLISYAIYDKLDVMDNSREQPAMAVIDRGFSFRIENPLGFNLDLGLVVTRIPIKVLTEKKVRVTCHTYLLDSTNPD